MEFELCVAGADYSAHVDDVATKARRDAALCLAIAPRSPAQQLAAAIPRARVGRVRLGPDGAAWGSSGVETRPVLIVWSASWRAEAEATDYDRAAIGDALADHVDGGGHVVLCYTNPAPGGRWEVCRALPSPLLQVRLPCSAPPAGPRVRRTAGWCPAAGEGPACGGGYGRGRVERR